MAWLQLFLSSGPSGLLPPDTIACQASQPALETGSSSRTTMPSGGPGAEGGGTRSDGPDGTTQWLEIPAIPIPAFPVVRPARPPAPGPDRLPGKPARPDDILTSADLAADIRHERELQIQT